MTKNNIMKIIGAFVFIFGIFFLLLSITNIFNDIDFIEQYNNCIEVSKYEPGVLDICKQNVSEGLGLAIRSNQVELTTGQYLKVYISQIINVLLAVLLIIIGDFLYIASKKEVHQKTQETKKVMPKAKPMAVVKKTVKKKATKKKK